MLSGPSGVGKSTVAAAVQRACPEIWVSVSVTTRPPRPEEADGVSYFFVDEARFAKLVASGEMLEWARFAGHCYGTPRRPVEEKLEAGTPVLLEIDPQGARQVQGLMADAQLVFLAPPDWEELVRRLTERGTETPEVVEHRLAVAREEMARQEDYDLTLTNVDVNAVCAQLVSLMQSPSETWKA